MPLRSKAAQKEEYEKFKSEINLVDFILNDNSNYYLKTSLSNSKRFILNNKKDFSKITVSNTDSFWIFKDHKSGYSGTILDYCFNYKGLNFKESCSLLRKCIDSYSLDQPRYNQIQKTTSKASRPKAAEYFSFSKLDSSYLNQRGLTDETLFSKSFIGRVGTKNYYNSNQEKRFSTVFPMYGNLSNEVVGLEKSNPYFKGSLADSNKAIGFWKSNPVGEKPTIFIGENPIDLMAHYQIKNPNNQNNILYIGTFGDLSLNRIKKIEKYIAQREHKINEIVLGFDNDKAGRRFGINMTGNLSLRGTNTEASFFINVDPRPNHNGLAMLTVSSTKSSVLENVKEKLLKLANNLPLTSNFELQYRGFHMIESNKYQEMKVILANKNEALEPLEKFISDYRNNNFSIERAISKDFGQDLENKLGIIRRKKQIGLDKEGKPFYKNEWINVKEVSLNRENDLEMTI